MLGTDGTLTETARAPVDEFILPMGAGLGSAGGPVIVADGMGGTFLVFRDPNNNAPSLVAVTLDLDGSEADAVTAGGGGVIVQTEWMLNLIVAGTSAILASGLTIPGQPYQGYAGGSSVVRLDATAGAAAALDGLFAAALGDYGVVLVRLTGRTLEQVGGYYRRFGTDLIHEDTIHEGNY